LEIGACNDILCLHDIVGEIKGLGISNFGKNDRNFQMGGWNRKERNTGGNIIIYSLLTGSQYVEWSAMGKIQQKCKNQFGFTNCKKEK
jgi:hypothetical protein